MSQNVVAFPQEFVLVIRYLSTGKIRYEIKRGRWIFEAVGQWNFDKNSLTKLQESYAAQGKELLHFFVGSDCQLRSFAIALNPTVPDRSDQDYQFVELLIQSRSTGQTHYVTEAVDAVFGKDELDRLDAACNDNGHALLHAFVGSRCHKMFHYV